MNTTEPNFQFDSEYFQEELKKIQKLAEEVMPNFTQLSIDPKAQKNNQYYQELTNIIDDLHPADMALVLESLPLQERILVWRLSAIDEEGNVLLEVSDAVRDTLIEAMGEQELVHALSDLDADELAELAESLPKNVVTRALSSRDDEEKAQIQAALSYEKNQVGTLMDFEYISIRADVTCEVVLRYLRRFDILPDHTDKIFVVDNQEVLQGVLPIQRLLVSEPEMLVSDMMARDVVKFHPEDDVEDAAQAFERYDLVTAPVVDNNQHIIGRLTVDEMVDVIREESEADMLNMAGLQDEEDLFAPVWDSIKNRWVWLAINLCTAFVASRVISLFEGSIEKIVALAALMPIVAGIGGNSGNQTITMIVRDLATGQMSASKTTYLLRKEISVAIVNGLLWGSVIGLLSFIMYHNIGLGVVMVVAMTLNLILASIVGVLIPMTLEKFGRDPALGSSVLITAVTDSGGFFIFLGLASIFLLK